MTHLVIGLDEYNAISSPLIMKDVVEYGQWRAAVAGQQTLLQTGVAVALLSSALANLPNLKTIDIRDFNSPTRYRDAVGLQPSEWRSYGSSSYRQWKHKQPYPPGLICRSKEFIGQVFKVLLSALDRCSPELDCLEVITQKRDRSLTDDAFAFSPALGAGLIRTLHSLTKLHLSLLCPDQSRNQPALIRVGYNSFGDVFDPLTAYTRNFLAHTKNVTWLRLNFNYFDETSTKFLNWLSLKPGCDPEPKTLGWNEMNPAPVALPLRRLDLGMISVQPNVLHRVLAKFPDLESLCLRGATLELDQGLSNRDLLDKNGTYEDGDCVWARFIRGLSVSTPSLKHLTLAMLKQVAPRGTENIIFRSDPYSPDKSHSATGIDRDKAKLRLLADMTFTQATYEMALNVEAGVGTDEDSDVNHNSFVEDDDTTDASITG